MPCSSHGLSVFLRAVSHVMGSALTLSLPLCLERVLRQSTKVEEHWKCLLLITGWKSCVFFIMKLFSIGSFALEKLLFSDVTDGLLWRSDLLSIGKIWLICLDLASPACWGFCWDFWFCFFFEDINESVEGCWEDSCWKLSGGDWHLFTEAAGAIASAASSATLVLELSFIPRQRGWWWDRGHSNDHRVVQLLPFWRWNNVLLGSWLCQPAKIAVALYFKNGLSENHKKHLILLDLVSVEMMLS